MPFLELFGREHADAVLGPLQAVADADPLAAAVVLLGGRFVLEILRQHVKQLFDVTVIHGSPPPLSAHRAKTAADAAASTLIIVYRLTPLALMGARLEIPWQIEYRS